MIAALRFGMLIELRMRFDEVGEPEKTKLKMVLGFSWSSGTTGLSDLGLTGHAVEVQRSLRLGGQFVASLEWLDHVLMQLPALELLEKPFVVVWYPLLRLK